MWEFISFYFQIFKPFTYLPYTVCYTKPDKHHVKLQQIPKWKKFLLTIPLAAFIIHTFFCFIVIIYTLAKPKNYNSSGMETDPEYVNTRSTDLTTLVIMTHSALLGTTVIATSFVIRFSPLTLPNILNQLERFETELKGNFCKVSNLTLIKVIISKQA